MLWTWGIVATTVAASVMAFRRPVLFDRGMLIPSRMRGGAEWWRFVTHGWLHADYSHLLVNLFMLVQFGPFVESDLPGFPVLYLGGVVVGALPAFIKHRNNPLYSSLGASGAVSAVVLAFAVLRPDAQLLVLLIIPLPAWAVGVLFLAYETWASRKTESRVAHDAHLWGAVFGLAYAWISLKVQSGL
jgi:membrane associated rhomboid family serine protease